MLPLTVPANNFESYAITKLPATFGLKAIAKFETRADLNVVPTAFGIFSVTAEQTLADLSRP